MKKEPTEQTMAGSSGSFSAPMGFVTKKEIYKMHNKKKSLTVVSGSFTSVGRLKYVLIFHTNSTLNT